MSGLMILVAGPYRSGTDGDPARIQANVDAMTRTALALHRRGHLPVMGEWFALPLIEAAVADGDSEEDADAAIFHPVAEQLLARCDGCLRIGGPSEGADRMVATARRLGKSVFTVDRRGPRAVTRDPGPVPALRPVAAPIWAGNARPAGYLPSGPAGRRPPAQPAGDPAADLLASRRPAHRPGRSTVERRGSGRVAWSGRRMTRRAGTERKAGS